MNYHIVQNVLARLLRLRSYQLTLPGREQQTELLSRSVVHQPVPAMAIHGRQALQPQKSVKLLGYWSPTTGYHAQERQPGEGIFSSDTRFPSWAQYLTHKASIYGRSGWALFEVEEKSQVAGGLTMLHYWLIPVLDAVHHHAEQQYLPEDNDFSPVGLAA